MKKYLFILLFLTIIFGCQKRESANVNIREFDNSLNESNSDSKIDISKMEKIVNEAGSMNLDVFFAISVLHKNFISQFLNEVQDLSEEKQKDFFLNKKNEFFKKLKFSEEEYNSFMEKNSGLMNDYINRHPEIAEYLTTIN
ncbi:MAG TPA: hypothetical protein PK385_04545 [Spirochaetota bacterium]|nr:hypothetical protein [Spirochaetota bacterium]HOS32862.1 hypothetical protein [Spirochaetota bacterium]HOS55307.1 hypothetical protein [Spirochaetota bacterium]HPK63063.1 hypothetical protein [Spirochaetota bacterium]HQF76910.1 hypothetical protein [Spirochaetota bacterium]